MINLSHKKKLHRIGKEKGRSLDPNIFGMNRKRSRLNRKKSHVHRSDLIMNENFHILTRKYSHVDRNYIRLERSLKVTLSILTIFFRKSSLPLPKYSVIE